MRIYFKKNPVKFHPVPIWNEEESDFLKRGPDSKKNNVQDELRDGISSWSKKTEQLLYIQNNATCRIAYIHLLCLSKYPLFPVVANNSHNICNI